MPCVHRHEQRHICDRQAQDRLCPVLYEQEGGQRLVRTYLENIEDPATRKLVYPTFGAFLTEVRKAFRSADQVQDALQIGESETREENGRAGGDGV